LCAISVVVAVVPLSEVSTEVTKLLQVAFVPLPKRQQRPGVEQRSSLLRRDCLPVQASK
jgi:hypothetical protein